jgi:NADH-quinone oxidoreductase subunit M
LQAAAANGVGMSTELQVWLFLALFAGFAIKVPLFPLHTWLPLAHTEAPAAGSILLAGVLLKIGTYGFLRFNLPMLPAGTAVCMPWLLWLSVAGIIYGALVALAQSDMKKLIAYSSVSHLGFCMLGIFALNRVAVQGGTLQMINHGLSTGGLFAIVGMMYERYHTRRIADFGGIAAETPILAFFMVFMTLASIGLPGLNGFAGEFMLLIGMFDRAWATANAASEWATHYRVISVLATSGVVLGAWYMLYLVLRVFFGPLRERRDGHPIHDLSLREVAALVPLCVVIVWIGVQPKFFLDRMAPSLDQLTAHAMTAVSSAQPPAPPDVDQPSDEITKNRDGGLKKDRKVSVSKEANGDRRVEKVTQRRRGAKAQENRTTEVREDVGQVTLPNKLNQFCLPHPRGSDRSRLCASAPLRETFLGLNSPDRFPLEIARVA